MKVVFWLLFLIIFYHYFLFPLLTLLWARIRRLDVKKDTVTGKVTLIIAAYNEEKCIREKIENSFVLDYPKNKLEIIVVSDGSTDATPRIVEEYREQGVISLFSPPRKGKTSALNRAVNRASGDVIVFSDANSMYKSDAVLRLTANFADPSIGGVCGRKSIVRNTDREASEGDNLFWRVESFLKIQQSRAGSITTGDGEIFAVRRQLYQEIPEEIINDDTAITFRIIEQGFRVVYEPEAVSLEEASIVLEDDFNVKVRMVSGGFQTLQYFGRVVFPPRSFFAVQFLSHKVLRWTMPLWLSTLLFVNVFLTEGFYGVFLGLQGGCYLLALAGFLLKNTGRTPPFFLYIPLYYCIMNIAAFRGLLAFLKRESQLKIWKKADR
jgi:cellulose synthase/poly-beta-1,6-N-acetylglucosamine synthase-like glycosyltransferase